LEDPALRSATKVEVDRKRSREEGLEYSATHQGMEKRARFGYYCLLKSSGTFDYREEEKKGR